MLCSAVELQFLFLYFDFFLFLFLFHFLIRLLANLLFHFHTWRAKRSAHHQLCTTTNRKWKCGISIKFISFFFRIFLSLLFKIWSSSGILNWIQQVVTEWSSYGFAIVNHEIHGIHDDMNHKYIVNCNVWHPMNLVFRVIFYDGRLFSFMYTLHFYSLAKYHINLVIFTFFEKFGFIAIFFFVIRGKKKERNQFEANGH